MICDCFLFFDELELLKLRLEYLDPYVDKFIIVEADQTFSGRSKKFNLETVLPTLGKFQDKIKYVKVQGNVCNYSDLKIKLLNDNNNTSSYILTLIETHNHYHKNQLRWLLDSYHRECLHYAIQALCDDDICILSDIDEVPNIGKIDLQTLDTPIVCIQHMFTYFINYHSHSNWKGSIIARANFMKAHSLNSLRLRPRSDDADSFQYIDNCGYHFSSIGSVNKIVHKMNSWSHQELNTITNRASIAFNMKYGQDVFNRRLAREFTDVDLDNDMFDARMSEKIKKLNFDLGPRVFKKGLLQYFLVVILWLANFIEKNIYKISEKIHILRSS